MEKTTVFNLIILDESGSMDSLKNQTISGCNETLNVVRTLQKKHGDTQRNLVSIYLFQSESEIPSRYIFKNAPIDNVKNITDKEYRPWGMTPLLDAVGATLVDLKAVASTHDDATGVVTIITDGMENSSKEYTVDMVVKLIEDLKSKGWTFNFIGANIDVDMISKKLKIDNAMAFCADEEGTADMFKSFNSSLMAHEEARIKEDMCLESMDDKIKMRKSMSKNFFKF